jgi:hypothetical protein
MKPIKTVADLYDALNAQGGRLPHNVGIGRSRYPSVTYAMMMPIHPGSALALRTYYRDALTAGLGWRSAESAAMSEATR